MTGLTLFDRAPCPACAGSGEVGPSYLDPSADPRVPWRDVVALAEARVAAGLESRESNAILSGFIRPVPCRACGGSGRNAGRAVA